MANLFGVNKLREIATEIQTANTDENVALAKTWHNYYRNMLIISEYCK